MVGNLGRLMSSSLKRMKSCLGNYFLNKNHNNKPLIRIILMATDSDIGL